MDNQLIGHTDGNGRALLNDLLPYESNRVNIEPTEIPLDASIGARTLVVTPGFRSGVVQWNAFRCSGCAAVPSG